MASSIISRNQGILLDTNDSSVLLQAGFTQKAFRALIDDRLISQYTSSTSETFNSSSTLQVFRDYVDTSLSSIVPILLNASQDTSLPLDRFSNGNELVRYVSLNSGNTTSDDVSHQAALAALRESIDLQPRNPDGGYWYYVYPEWSYLDGMYSLAPFYSLYTLVPANASTGSDTPDQTKVVHALNTTAISDILHQFSLLWQHCYHSETGLLVHGYDWSRTAVWVDPSQDTGASPHVWGRSLGWYSMALVDTLEILRPIAMNHRDLQEGWNSLKDRFVQLSHAIVNATDPVSGAWWQIMDQPGKEGNYIESSGSAMFVYTLLKGLRLGYLSDVDVNTTFALSGTPSESGQEEGERTPTPISQIATRAYSYIVQNFVVDNGNGTLGYNGTVSVCSLNSTASYEYYVTRPISYNSVLGSAAFVLASLEYEKFSE
ncbi:Six-hairpin glycosidase [Dendrothele bispora CBS 962.96]|uniref:Six-hairpin glycosidase n=1 Tax=Dendrothele bispora (strain CBS 962.96) TaxID=1314807 RepID=A0A4S8MRR5_DENBC|nr:Six-hairpin glycosidase [Dendrothele bispora CBS 962.96]